MFANFYGQSPTDTLKKAKRKETQQDQDRESTLSLIECNIHNRKNL